MKKLTSKKQFNQDQLSQENALLKFMPNKMKPCKNCKKINATNRTNCKECNQPLNEETQEYV